MAAQAFIRMTGKWMSTLNAQLNEQTQSFSPQYSKLLIKYYLLFHYLTKDKNTALIHRPSHLTFSLNGMNIFALAGLDLLWLVLLLTIT